MNLETLLRDAHLPSQLQSRLLQPLPGRSAQELFEPEFSFGRHYAPPPLGARSASVLILLFQREGLWRFPLTVRPQTMAAHAGQISLPGGMVEPDEDGPTAALRELTEELGVESTGIEVLGALTPLYVFVSNFHVTPWVAWVDAPPTWIPNESEVAEVFELPLTHLFDPNQRGRHTYDHRGMQFSAPHVSWEMYRIWGATSMILSELTVVLGELAEVSSSA